MNARTLAATMGLIAAYALLPWMAHSSAALTVNAYDLAEWTSIHPAVRADALLLTPLLLRLPLVCIAGYVGLSGRSWPQVGLVVALATALLPPLEFFGGASDDPNYRQQLVLALLALATGLALPSFTPQHSRAVLSAVALLIGLATGTWGVTRALPLISSLDLRVTPGAGTIAFGAISLALMFAQIRGRVSSPANSMRSPQS